MTQAARVSDEAQVGRGVAGGAGAGRVASPVVVMASPDVPQYSESFIRAHLERLPGRVEPLTGRPLSRDGGGREVVGWTWRRRLSCRAASWLGWQIAGRQRVRAIAGHLRRVGASVVLAQYGTTGTELVEPCGEAGVPLVVHFRGYDAFWEEVVARHAAGYRAMFAYASAVVVVSKPMWGRLVELGAPEERLHLIPSGTDLSRFTPVDPSANPARFVAVGRFVEKKAPQLTLLAFAKVAATHAEAALVMVGDGPLRGACEELAHGLGVGDRVTFAGVLSHEQVAEQMGGARAFVQHSIRPASGDAEGTPGSVREASATGLPVIATRHAGIPEAVIDGRTGLLVDERDVAGMAERMRRVLDEPALARRLGEAGRKHIGEHYDLDGQVGKLWRVLESAMAERRG